MQERTLEDKINAIGSDTIMGAVSNLEKSSEKQLEEIQDTETKEVAKEEQDQYAGKSINKISQKALHKMMFGPIPPMKKDQKVGRNDLCPCGSGKKYKNCCLASGKYETYTR